MAEESGQEETFETVQDEELKTVFALFHDVDRMYVNPTLFAEPTMMSVVLSYE